MFKVILIIDGKETLIIETQNNELATAKFHLEMRKRYNKPAWLKMFFNDIMIKNYSVEINVKFKRYAFDSNPTEFIPMWTLTEIYPMLIEFGATMTKTSLNNYANKNFIEGLDFIRTDRIYIIFESGFKKLYEYYCKVK